MRANRIIKYLVTKGVEPIQVRTDPAGNIITENKALISIIVISNDHVEYSDN